MLLIFKKNYVCECVSEWRYVHVSEVTQEHQKVPWNGSYRWLGATPVGAGD